MVDITVYAYHFLARRALSTSYDYLREKYYKCYKQFLLPSSNTSNPSYRQGCVPLSSIRYKDGLDMPIVCIHTKAS